MNNIMFVLCCCNCRGTRFEKVEEEELGLRCVKCGEFQQPEEMGQNGGFIAGATVIKENDDSVRYKITSEDGDELFIMDAKEVDVIRNAANDEDALDVVSVYFEEFVENGELDPAILSDGHLLEKVRELYVQYLANHGTESGVDTPWTNTDCLEEAASQCKQEIAKYDNDRKRVAGYLPNLMTLLLRGWLLGTVKIVDSVDGGVACKIGRYDFWFGGEEAEDYNAIAYLLSHKSTEIIDQIYDALMDMARSDNDDAKDSFLYYADYLNDKFDEGKFPSCAFTEYWYDKTGEHPCTRDVFRAKLDRIACEHPNKKSRKQAIAEFLKDASHEELNALCGLKDD